MGLASAQRFYTYIEVLPVTDENQMHFSLVASLALEVSPSRMWLSNDPSKKKKKKKKNLHSFWASTRPYIGWGTMCGEPVWSTQVGVWFGI